MQDETFETIYNQAITKVIFNKIEEARAHLKTAKPHCVTDAQISQYTQLLNSLNIKLNDRPKCLKSIDKMVLSNLDWNVKNESINMLAQYTEPLFFTQKIRLSVPTPDPYHISSPSIVKMNDKYRCNLRAVNYIYNPQNGSYTSKDMDGIVRTRNYCVTVCIDNLDTITIADMFEIKEMTDFHIHPCHVMGMEDVRLFGEQWFFCTRLDATECHKPKVCLGRYLNNEIKSLKVLDYNSMGTEKNWLPCFVDDHHCKVIYSFEPLTVFHLNLDTAVLTPYCKNKVSKMNLDTFRGSAVPIKYRDGWLMTVHQVYYHQRRKYLHKFVWLNDNFDQIKMSRCFHFEKLGVEFNLGIALHPKGLLVAYSIDDACGSLALLDYGYLDKMLQF